MIVRKLKLIVGSSLDYFNDTSIQQSDIAIFGLSLAIWINGTRPALINGNSNEIGTPDNAFPFSRLASVSLADQSATFLYHQINGTTLAEEQWDASLNAWIPSVYIILSDS